VTAGTTVVIRGGGDLGTGVAHALASAGYTVVILETERPRAVRRSAAFAQAVYTGRTTVENLSAVLVHAGGRRALSDLEATLESTVGVERGDSNTPAVPVLVDPCGHSIASLRPDVVVDARMAKRNLGTRRNDAPLTIALGPGFEAGVDVDLVIETQRGETLGRVIERGSALADTGVPGVVGGVSAERLIKSPAAGEFRSSARIGDIVREGQAVGAVSGVPARAQLSGRLRGLAADGLVVAAGEKIGDVDPRGEAVDPSLISDKARAVGTSVLEVLATRGILPAGARDPATRSD
jgi:xanthine dehydrogenase accessory factor